ncbi:MAG: FAD-dependent oxidoreductase [Dehalococcoidia bacterium]|nr:FAD-dependent oxidoreductase [Dehalococcoidia bacterium]
MTNFKHLLEPIKLGDIQLKNRMVMLSMGLGYEEDGKPTQRLYNFLGERAKGGAGMIITSLSFFPGPMGGILDATTDEYLPHLKKLVDTVHQYDVPLIGQLITIHIWRKDKSAPIEIVGPSEVAVRPNAIKPRALTLEEIEIVLDQYEDSANRARRAGFDGIEIMGGIGGLISRFMSPCANLREDKYGGSFENRMRFPLEVIERVRKGAGADCTIGFRYSGHEYLEGGYDIAGAGEIGKALQDTGVAWLNIQAGWHDSPVPLVTKEVPEGYFTDLSEGIKKAVSIPVITGYRITDPVVGETILAEGKADLIGMARAFIADPEFAQKVKEGRENEIRRCICCCRCIDQAVGAGMPLDICSVNPRVGVDIETDISVAEDKKKVMVIGGGPGGLQAARIAALQGHDVTLYERGPRLGGAMVFGGILNTQTTKLTEYFKKEMAKLPVKVKLNTEVDRALIEREKPDAVIVATGGTPLSLEIPGIKGDNVSSLKDAIGLVTGRMAQKHGLWQKFIWGMGLLTFRYFYNVPFMRWALGSGLLFGKKVAIIGGGFAACELAEFLIEHGKKVTIIAEDSRLGTDIGPSTRWVIMMKLRKAGVNILTEAQPLKVTPKGIMCRRRGEEQFVEADSIISALGMNKGQENIDAFSAVSVPVHVIGDCADPKKIAEANKAGYRTAIGI